MSTTEMQTRLETATRETLDRAIKRARLVADLMSEGVSLGHVPLEHRVVLDPCAGYLPPDETFAPVILTDEHLLSACPGLAR